MSSTNKTSLGLNMWEASDKPVRQDFVNDNVIIDEKITKLNSDLVLKANASDLVNTNSNLSGKANANDFVYVMGFTGDANTLKQKGFGLYRNSIGCTNCDADAMMATFFVHPDVGMQILINSINEFKWRRYWYGTWSNWSK